MRLGKFIVFTSALLMTAAATTANAGPRVHRGPTVPRLSRTRIPAPRPRMVTQIDPGRSTQIQSALIRSGYLTGEPSGMWDTQTQSAMEKLQADNGWQTKLVPDARAIIKLGLGPGSASPADLTPGANETEASSNLNELSPGTPSNQ